MNKEYLEVGKLVGHHGIKGELKILYMCDGYDFIQEFDEFYLGKSKEKILVETIRENRNTAVAKFKGVSRREESEKFIGEKIYIDKQDINLEEGRYFVKDVVGCEVFDVDSEESYGEIVDIIQTGANDVYISKGNGREYLIPVIEKVIIDINIVEKKVIIKPLEGLFDI
ncbi:MAG: 16S rRNA processing protein RimM [Oscillospiraceae bacterium]|nr:16S rRNA processing protein RimM [Oscillospiraceae bacterium]